MAIPGFAEGHVSFSCAEDVSRLRVVDSAIWLTKLGFTVVAAVVPFTFIITRSSPRLLCSVICAHLWSFLAVK